MARRFGKGDSYSNSNDLPSIPDYHPGGGNDWYVQTINRSNREFKMEADEANLYQEEDS